MTTVERIWDFENGITVPDAEYSELVRIRTETSNCDGHIYDHNWEVLGGNGERPSYGWSCSLPVHTDEQPHIAMASNRVLCRWGGMPGEPEVEVDPDPGPTFQPEQGVIYKFRNRPTLLLFVDKRKDGTVEVLDMTHERYRVLEANKLVPRPEGAEPPTPQQMAWVAKFMSERRAKVRETALQQKRDGFFKSTDDLNKVLLELNLAPVVPTVTGYFNSEIRFKAAPGMTKAQVQTAMQEWVKTTPFPEGITFEALHRGSLNAEEVTE